MLKIGAPIKRCILDAGIPTIPASKLLLPSFYAPLLSSLDLVRGFGPYDFSRSTEGTVEDYNLNVITCEIDESRFQGARRISEGIWSDTDGSGNTLTTLDGILIEGQRENEIIHSEEFDDVAWIKSGASVTANQVLSPDGVNTTGDLIDLSGDVNGRVYQQIVAGSNGPYTFSFWLRSVSGTGTWPVRLRNTTQAINIDSLVSLSTIWARFEIQLDTVTIGDIVTSYIGNRQVAGESLDMAHAWGADTEAGAFATSYTKTIASAFTRTKDILWYPSNNNINEVQGSAIIEFQSLGFNTGSLPRLFSINDNTVNNEILIQLTAENTINFKIITGGVDQVDISSANITSNTAHKVGIVWSSTYCNLYLDGVSITPDTSATLPTGLTHILIGSDLTTGTNQWNGPIKEIPIYKQILSDATMETLTQ